MEINKVTDANKTNLTLYAVDGTPKRFRVIKGVTGPKQVLRKRQQRIVLYMYTKASLIQRHVIAKRKVSLGL